MRTEIVAMSSEIADQKPLHGRGILNSAGGIAAHLRMAAHLAVVPAKPDLLLIWVFPNAAYS